MSKCACINSDLKKKKYIEKFIGNNYIPTDWNPNDRYNYDYQKYIQPYIEPKIYSEMLSAPETVYKREILKNIIDDKNNNQNFYKSEEVIIDSVPSIANNIPASISCCICCIIIIFIIKYLWK